mmetsp:Transcript_12435/g.19106  ORF Transcript_12435/g.19106 Transcript_12435/m.19106 type:complete len:237 (-) Transcript_12435:586-1296(-)
MWRCFPGKRSPDPQGQLLRGACRGLPPVQRTDQDPGPGEAHGQRVPAPGGALQAGLRARGGGRAAGGPHGARLPAAAGALQALREGDAPPRAGGARAVAVPRAALPAVRPRAAAGRARAAPRGGLPQEAAHLPALLGARADEPVHGPRAGGVPPTRGHLRPVPGGAARRRPPGPPGKGVPQPRRQVPQGLRREGEVSRAGAARNPSVPADPLVLPVRRGGEAAPAQGAPAAVPGVH